MERHISKLEIDTFRGIRGLKLDDFGDVNIITGDNNSGKTSLLEVVQSFDDPAYLKTWLGLGRSSGRRNSLSLFENFDMLFDVDSEQKKVLYKADFDGIDYTVSLDAVMQYATLRKSQMEELMGLRDVNREEDGIEEVTAYETRISINGLKGKKEVVYDFQQTFNFFSPKEECKNIIRISPEDHVTGTLFLSEILNESELYGEMLEILRLFDSDIISINADKSDGIYRNPSIIYKILSKKHQKAIPLNMYGDGMKKAVLLMSALIRAKNSVLLLDEFETAIHTSAMTWVFKWILETAKRLNVQIFMTSHSDEAIMKVLECSPELQGDIRQITLYKNNDKTVARVLDGKRALTLRKKGVELR